ncbi:MAG: hypothetical protein KBD21_03430 [Candidatus Pacebacteria bacterium]|nr:hypothetical protein [Candidatus Paceibacterota bacterium]
MGITFYFMLALTGLSVWLFFRNVKGEKKPSVLAWLIITATTAIALLSFLFNLGELNGDSVAKGALFFANSGASATIVARLLYLGGYNIKLTTFDKFSALAAMGILAYWFLFDDPLVANLCTQGLMVISYILILERVFETKGVSDDHWFWITALGMSLLSLVSINDGGQLLETVNTWRSIVSTGTVLGSIYFFKLRRTA